MEFGRLLEEDNPAESMIIQRSSTSMDTRRCGATEGEGVQVDPWSLGSVLSSSSAVRKRDPEAMERILTQSSGL